MAERYDYLIIGGGIAGTTAAETIRSRDRIGSIALVDEERHFLYSRVLLPEFAEGVLPEDRLMLRSLGNYEAAKIDLYAGDSVMALDVDKQEATLGSGKVIIFSKALFAGGSRVAAWPYEAGALGRVVRLRTLEDGERISDLISRYREVAWLNPQTGVREKRRGRVLVVGGGLGALDFIELFYKAGLEVVLLLRRKRFWEDRLNEDGSRIFADIWKRRGMEIIFDSEVKSVSDSPDGASVITSKGDKIVADIIAVGIGTECNMELARSQAILSESGILVNEYMEASHKNFWAAGDTAEYPDLYAGLRRVSGSWGESFMAGRVAGWNMALMPGEEDKRIKFDSVFSYALNHLDNHIALVGYARAENFETITRNREFKGEYARFFLKDDRLIGAVILNGQEMLGSITRLIRERKDLSGARQMLADPNFNLAGLL